MDVAMLKDKPSAAVRQSKRKLGLAEESGGWLSVWEGERSANIGSGRAATGSAMIWSNNAAAGNAWLVAYLVAGNPLKIARKTSQQGRNNLFVNDCSPHNYLSILISKMQQGHVYY